MRCLIIVAFLVLAVNAATDKELWSEFKQKYGREYRNLREEQTRFSIFQDNLRDINAHNEKYQRGESTYYKGINQFTDMTLEEFKTKLSYNLDTKPVINATEVYHPVSGRALPKSVNWVSKGIFPAVKSQGDCGGCWTFSAIGTLEAHYALKTGSHVSLSEQNLLDCTSKDDGCKGGWVQAAYDYIKSHGIESERDYPYKGVSGSCRFDRSKSVTKVKGFIEVEHTESALQNAIANIGPIAVGVNANWYWQYGGGIFDDPACTNSDMNHAVVGVGYGTENGVDYWLIRNSWGGEFGENGYIKHVRNKNMQCGIGTELQYPIL